MNTTVERLVTAAFVSALVLLCVSATVAHVAKDAVVAQAQAAHRASTVLRSLANLQVAVLADESAGRGFAATGDDAFLKRNDTAQAQARTELETLRRELGESSLDAATVADLASLVEARFTRTEATVTARRAGGLEAAANLIATRQGLQLTDAILAACGRLQSEAEGRLAGARSAAESRTATASRVSALAVVLGLATLALASVLIRSRIVAARSERHLMANIVDLVRAADEAIIGKTPDGIVKSWNSGAEKLYGWSEKDMVGASIERVVPADRIDELRAIMARVSRGERVGPLETERVRRDGTRVRVSLNLTPIRDASGSVVAMATIARDATAAARDAAGRDALIAALRAAAARAEALNELLPTCAWCKAVRDEAGRWRPLDAFLREQADVQFTHGICPDCARRLRGQESAAG